MEARTLYSEIFDKKEYTRNLEELKKMTHGDAKTEFWQLTADNVYFTDKTYPKYGKMDRTADILPYVEDKPLIKSGEYINASKVYIDTKETKSVIAA